MSLQNVSNHKQLLIAKNLTRSTNLAGVVATPSNLADGEVVVTDIAGRILDTTTILAVDQVQIVQGQGSTKPLIKSAAIPKAQVTAKTLKYTGATQQVSTVGYNGTTGAIVNPGIGANIILRNTFKTNFFQFSDKLMESIVGLKVGALDTTSSIANTLQKAAILDVRRYVNIPFKVELYSAHAGAAITGAPTSFGVTNASTLVTWAGTDPSNINAGDFIRLGGTTTSTPVYRVASVDLTNNYLILDAPYQATTATILVANVEVITKAQADTNPIGIIFTGLPQAKFAPNIFRYETSKFVTTATNFSTTEVINAATVPTEGSGVYEQIAEEEFFFQLGEGMHDNALIQVPPVTMRSNVELSGQYSIMDLEFQTQSGTMSFINNPIARKQVRIAGNTNGGIAAGKQFNTVTGVSGSNGTGIREVLALFCSPAPAAFAV
jgi:hypothetical protein